MTRTEIIIIKGKLLSMTSTKFQCDCKFFFVTYFLYFPTLALNETSKISLVSFEKKKKEEKEEKSHY